MKKKGKKVTVHFLQKLTGKLQFITHGIPAGWAFLHHLYDIQKLSLPVCQCHQGYRVNPNHHVKLSDGAYQDLCVWFRFLTFPAHGRDREVPFLCYLGTLPGGVPELKTDASGTMCLGFGALFRNHFLYSRWPVGFFKKRTPSIALLELFAVVVAVDTWSTSMSGAEILVQSDNETVVHCMNKASSKCKWCMSLLRHLTLICLRFQIHLVAHHIEGKINSESDALSRLDIPRFNCLRRVFQCDFFQVGPTLQQDRIGLTSHIVAKAKPLKKASCYNFNFQGHRKAPPQVPVVKPRPRFSAVALSSFNASDIGVESARLSSLRSHPRFNTGFVQEILDRFDGLMTYLGREPVIDEENMKAFIAHLSLANYSNQYIWFLTNMLRPHHSLTPDAGEFPDTPSVCITLSTAGTALGQEDNRIPLSHPLIDQLCMAFDRDFTPYIAVTLKAVLWLGICCMLRLSELAGPQMTNQPDHSLQYDDFCLSQGRDVGGNSVIGISISLRSWKLNSRGKTLFFPVHHCFQPVIKAMKDFLTLRGSSPGHLFTLEGGARWFFSNFFFRAFARAVDHSDWCGLAVSTHSMRITGATWCYENHEDPARIVYLGRWKSASVFKYFCDAWIQDPQALQETGRFDSHRESEKHLFCSCPPNMSDCNVNMIKEAALKRCSYNTARAVSGRVLPNVRTLHSLLQEGHRANPILKCFQNWNDLQSLVWLYREYNGDHLWFTVAVYLARARLLSKRRWVKYSAKVITSPFVYVPNT